MNPVQSPVRQLSETTYATDTHMAEKRRIRQSVSRGNYKTHWSVFAVEFHAPGVVPDRDTFARMKDPEGNWVTYTRLETLATVKTKREAIALLKDPSRAAELAYDTDQDRPGP